MFILPKISRHQLGYQVLGTKTSTWVPTLQDINLGTKFMVAKMMSILTLINTVKNSNAFFSFSWLIGVSGSGNRD